MGTPWKKMGKPWEKIVKPWEKMGKPQEKMGKPWKGLGTYGKTLGKDGKTLGKDGKTLGKDGKTQICLICFPCFHCFLMFFDGPKPAVSPGNLDPQGEELLDYNQERQGLPCTALAWHPTSKASRCVFFSASLMTLGLKKLGNFTKNWEAYPLVI